MYIWNVYLLRESNMSTKDFPQFFPQQWIRSMLDFYSLACVITDNFKLVENILFLFSHFFFDQSLCTFKSL